VTFIPVRLTEDRIGEASAVLGRAFQHDPLQTWTLPDADERARRSPAHFEPLLRFGTLFGEVLTTPGEVRGAAVWLPPDEPVTAERVQASGLDTLATRLGDEAAARFEGTLDFLGPYHERNVPGPHWYLMVIGVDPSHHGQGVGSGLIRPVLARADAGNVPCYLETAQPTNVAYYRRLGFRVVDDLVEPRSGLRLWTFLRDPHPA
jgi:ribosomal protein S18 acetylase RimI-like enzyme